MTFFFMSVAVKHPVMKYIFNVIQESNNDVLRTITEVFYCVDGADCNGLVKGERNSNSRRS